jgi:hypothetical protein
MRSTTVADDKPVLDLHRWDIAGQLGAFEPRKGDWTDGEMSIPKHGTARRRAYDGAHRVLVLRSFRGTLTPLEVDARELSRTNAVVNRERYALYKRMLRAGDMVPALVVERIGGYLYVVDGNHRTQAAIDAKRYKLPAYLLHRVPLMEKLTRRILKARGGA